MSGFVLIPESKFGAAWSPEVLMESKSISGFLLWDVEYGLAAALGSCLWCLVRVGLRPSRVDVSDGFSIASYYTLFFLLKLFGHSLSAGYCTYRGWTENIMVMISLMNDRVMLAVGCCCLHSTLSTIGMMGITLRTIDTDGNATLATTLCVS